MYLNAIPPLVGTMRKTEAEIAAALIVRACHVRGDRWQPLRPDDLGTVIKADLEAKQEPWASLNTNPFCRPDFHKLIEFGFAAWVGEATPKAIEFTDKGLLALQRWVRRPEVSNG